jgi:alkanesulfonate monooxygenase SsuD/methylene tetrahydromethanopterin reductase-like flavin-dependent oxidoreductase (luciferase family)
MTRFGLSLLRLSPRAWIEASIEAERLGFESVWMSEHLVLPAEFERANYPYGRLPIDPMTPVFDVMVYLSAISALTTRLRLGAFVFELGLRHPFIAARAISTLDVVSGTTVSSSTFPRSHSSPSPPRARLFPCT